MSLIGIPLKSRFIGQNVNKNTKALFQGLFDVLFRRDLVLALASCIPAELTSFLIGGTNILKTSD